MFRQNRLRKLDHLLVLVGHKEYWNKLELNLLVKCAIEEALSNPGT